MALGHPAGRRPIVGSMTHPCPNCKADAEITEHIRFPGAFGSSSPIRPDRLILDCPNCGHVTVN